jgi:hypothetical protein
MPRVTNRCQETRNAEMAIETGLLPSLFATVTLLNVTVSTQSGTPAPDLIPGERLFQIDRTYLIVKRNLTISGQ